MDIRKLQRTIVDGLEDVKGHDIVVFNTEHLSPLFERVIIASGTSNRQTKALAASVRDAVKAGGHGVLRTEGEANGEWIIVDCGAAVVHLMQPSIREYYHLEEIWGGKPVKMKFDSSPKRLVKAESDVAEPTAPKKAGAKTAAKRMVRAAAKTTAKPAAKTAAKSPVGRPAAKTGSTPIARKGTARDAALKTIKIGEPTARRKPVTARKAPATGVVRTVGVKRPAAAKKAPRKA